MDSLRQSRTDLEVLRKEIQAFYKSHAEAAKLAETLGADRLGLEAFGERMTAFCGARRPSSKRRWTRSSAS